MGELFMKLTSKDNIIIKKTASLLTKAKRESEGLFLLEGEKLLQEAFENNISIKYAFFNESMAIKHIKIATALKDNGALFYVIPDELMKKISDVSSPSGIVFVASMFSLYSINKITKGRFLALERMQDPGNLGAVLRIADAFSLDGIIIDNGCADIFSPKTIRGSMGSAFRVKIYKVDALNEALTALKEKKFCLYAADLDEKAVSLRDVQWTDKDIVLIGNEGAGVEEETKRMCQNALYIPMSGKAESLNASVAAGIIAWQMTNI